MEGCSSSNLLTVEEAANVLAVSPCWIRRHEAELPAVRVGRLVRFNSSLLQRQFSGRMPTGKPLKPNGGRMLQRYQQGSLYKRGKTSKIWYGRFREDVQTATGTIIRRTRNVRLGTLTELPTRASASVRMQQQIASHKKPTVAMTFSELHDRWQVADVPTIKRTTADYYQKILRSHILPVFGNQQVASITRENVQVFLAEQAPKYTRNTLRGMRVSLGKVLTWAMDNDWLEKNPCSKLKLPNAGVSQRKHKPLTVEQISAIVEKLKEPYATLVLFLAVTGLRIGEAIGIRWADFDGDMLTVSRTIYDGKPQSPKTESSNRSLPIPASLMMRMRALKGTEYVFRSREGTPVNPGNALKRYIRPVADSLNIQLHGWHDFRRTVATKLLRDGESPKVVSGILGNSVEILLKSYDLTETENFRAPLEQIANRLLPVVTKTAVAAAGQC